VLLVGVFAAAVVMVLVGRWRRADRSQRDRETALLLSSALESRIDARFRAVRGPAMAFDLSSLDARETSGVLRIAYTQNEDVTAVTLVDELGHAVVPAVFLARIGGSARASESLDDLERFAQRIPFDAARSRGRGVRGPYPSVRGSGSRIALGESIPVADGTRTWVLAAEVDADALLTGVARSVSDAEVLLVNDDVALGSSAHTPASLAAAVRDALHARRLGREPIELISGDWRAAVSTAPMGLDGALVVAWSGEEAAQRRARQNDLALGLVIVTILGAFAAAVFVALREPSAPPVTARGSSLQTEARVLGAVVKELANPIAATAAAAQLLESTGEGRSRVVETMQRSATRVQRAFRRVARLARGAEEVAHDRVDLAAITRREFDVLRTEAVQSGLELEYIGPEKGCMVRADADDIALLVQSLVDAARALAPIPSTVKITVAKGADEEQMLVVTDRGAMKAADRDNATALDGSARSNVASPTLALALASRICEDHRARFELVDRPGGGVDAVVHFGEARHSIRG
jgi:signal transduction histidine kinase